MPQAYIIFEAYIIPEGYITRSERNGNNYKKSTFVLVDKSAFFVGGGGWIRTTEVERQQIYSLPPLATRELLHISWSW